MDDITNITNFTNVTNINRITSAAPPSQLVFAVWENICRLAKKHLAKQLRNTWEISGKVLPFFPKVLAFVPNRLFPGSQAALWQSYGKLLGKHHGTAAIDSLKHIWKHVWLASTCARKSVQILSPG